MYEGLENTVDKIVDHTGNVRQEIRNDVPCALEGLPPPNDTWQPLKMDTGLSGLLQREEVDFPGLKEIQSLA